MALMGSDVCFDIMQNMWKATLNNVRVIPNLEGTLSLSMDSHGKDEDGEIIHAFFLVHTTYIQS